MSSTHLQPPTQTRLETPVITQSQLGDKVNRGDDVE